MSDNTSNKKGQKNNHPKNSINTSNPLLDFLFFQKIKQWGASTFVKLFAGLGVIVLLIELVVGICEVSEIFGWNWCVQEEIPVVEITNDQNDQPEKIVIPSLPPETIVQLVHRRFDNNNSADLQVEISPSTLNVGESMYMHFKTNSDGYLLVLNINSQGALSQLIPRISQEKSSYLKLKKDQERIIPDPDDPYDLPRFVIEEPTGKEILVVILVKENELPLGIINALPFASNLPMEQAKKQLNDLHDELSVSYEWSGLVFEYETFSSKRSYADEK
jgi:hypothetical protein